jgi:hypothetical protein
MNHLITPKAEILHTKSHRQSVLHSTEPGCPHQSKVGIGLILLLWGHGITEFRRKLLGMKTGLLQDARYEAKSQ